MMREIILKSLAVFGGVCGALMFSTPVFQQLDNMLSGSDPNGTAPPRHRMVKVKDLATKTDIVALEEKVQCLLQRLEAMQV